MAVFFFLQLKIIHEARTISAAALKTGNIRAALEVLSDCLSSQSVIQGGISSELALLYFETAQLHYLSDEVPFVSFSFPMASFVIYHSIYSHWCLLITGLFLYWFFSRFFSIFLWFFDDNFLSHRRCWRWKRRWFARNGRVAWTMRPPSSIRWFWWVVMIEWWWFFSSQFHERLMFSDVHI